MIYGLFVIGGFLVIILNFGVVYLNEYCVKCNKVSEFLKWKIEFRCIREIDFNYLLIY